MNNSITNNFYTPILRTHLSYGLLLLVMLFSFSAFDLQAQQPKDERSIVDKSVLDQIIAMKIIHSQKVFNWNDAPDQMIWSALVQSDSLAIIGYQPEEMTEKDRVFETRNISNEKWENGRLRIIDKINEWAKNHGSARIQNEVITEKLPSVPFMIVRLHDLDLLTELRAMPSFSSIEVGTYQFEIHKNHNDKEQNNGDFKIADGWCKGDGEAEAAAEMIDYDHDQNSATTPYKVSWHHEANDILDAWSYAPNQGANIKVALMDTGIDEDNPQFDDSVWTSEGSAGRNPLEYNSTFDNTVFDDCGHGTSMSSIIAGPHTANGRVGGIAPRANLASYRVTNDVLIDEFEEKSGFFLGCLAIAADSDVKVVSASLGKLFHSPFIADAVKLVIAEDKLFFCAAGTTDVSFLADLEDNAATWAQLADNVIDSIWFGPIGAILDFLGLPSPSDFFDIDQDALKVVVFPASMYETTAVTGRKEASNDLCRDCLGGDRVDFSPIMEHGSDEVFAPAYAMNSVGNWMRLSGGSSCGTATAAGIATLLWGERPNASAGTILNAMLEASSANSNGSINRFSHLGSGWIDVQTAVDALPDFAIPHTDHQVFLNVTKIEFPSIGDGPEDPLSTVLGKKVEWAIELNDKQHYARVKYTGVDGAMMHTGHPLTFMKDNAHGSLGALMKVYLGMSSPETSTLPLDVDLHEDDGGGFDIVSGILIDNDDHVASVEVNISLSSSSTKTFDVNVGDGHIIRFHYDLDFVPILDAAIYQDAECMGYESQFTAFPSDADEYLFFIDLNENGQLDSYEIQAGGLQWGPSNVLDIQVGGSSAEVNNGDHIGVYVSSSTAEGTLIDNSSATTVVNVPEPPAFSASESAYRKYRLSISTSECFDNYVYHWDFGDGNTTGDSYQAWNANVDETNTSGNMSMLFHTYDNQGFYTITLCTETVTGVQFPCQEYQIQPGNTCYWDWIDWRETSHTFSLQRSNKKLTVVPENWFSTANELNFVYDWGDGSTSSSTGPMTKIHQYASYGIYNITIEVTDPFNGCSRTFDYAVNITSKFSPVSTQLFDAQTPLLEVNPEISGPIRITPLTPVDTDLSGGTLGETLSIDDELDFNDDLAVDAGILDAGDGIKTMGGKPIVDENLLANKTSVSAPLPQYNLFPNPSSGYFNVSYDDSNYELISVEVLNINGTLLQRIEAEGTNMRIDNLSDGIFFVRMISKNKKTGEIHLTNKRIICAN